MFFPRFGPDGELAFAGDQANKAISGRRFTREKSWKVSTCYELEQERGHGVEQMWLVESLQHLLNKMRRCRMFRPMIRQKHPTSACKAGGLVSTGELAWVAYTCRSHQHLLTIFRDQKGYIYMRRLISSFRSPEASSQRSDARERTNPQASGSNTFGQTLYENPSSSRQGDRALIMNDPQKYAQKLLGELPSAWGLGHGAESSIENLAQKVSNVEKWNATLNALENEKDIPRHILDSHGASNIYFEYGQALKSAQESWQNQQFSRRGQIGEYKEMAGRPEEPRDAKEWLQQRIDKEKSKISQIDTFLTRQKAEYQQRVPQSYQLQEFRDQKKNESPLSKK